VIAARWCVIRKNGNRCFDKIPHNQTKGGELDFVELDFVCGIVSAAPVSRIFRYRND